MTTLGTLGLVGFGKMGSAMAARLVETGAQVIVWNRNINAPRDAGFAVAESPHRLAEQCETVISSLFDDQAVKAAYEGEDGLVAGADGKLFVEMSTVLPETQQHLAHAVAKAGGAFIECPVSGTTGPARSGQLIGLAGGELSDIERARPVLAPLCRKIEHIGPIGAGAIAKLAINLPLLAFWQAFGEAMALMRPLGKDSQWLVRVFSDTAGTPAVMKVKASALVETLAGRDSVAPTFDIDSMRKDLRLMLAEAERGHVPLPIAKAISAAFDEVAAAGWGPRDCAWVPAFWASKVAHE